MRGRRMLTAALLLALACGAARAAAGETARDITAGCALTSNCRTERVRDGLYDTAWRSAEQKRPYLEIETPPGERAGGLYVCFSEMPERWAVEEERDGAWQTLCEGGTDYLHAYVPLDGATHVRIVDTDAYAARLKINELFVLSQGETPGWVQRWEPTPEKADLLILSAHPDDELIFFGGAIPTYAVERGLNVVVAYMVANSATRRSELLNGLWSMGVRTYPVIGPFRDVYAFDVREMYEKWGRQRVERYVMGLVRRYKPEVMVTHDVHGEYGHGAHRVCADMARFCVENGANASVQRALAERYGLWQVKKLYLHLYEENPIEMNWRVPLAAFGGKTGLELAQEAFKLHLSQQAGGYTVTDEGEHSNARFGLAFTTVGEDVLGGDFMENIATPGEAARAGNGGA